MRKLLLAFLPVLIILSCKEKEQIPAGIIPKEKMQEVLWSMINAGEFVNGYIMSGDSLDKAAESAKVYGQVFQVHRITKDEFDKSYSYYCEHPGLMKGILDSLHRKQNFGAGQMQRKEDSMRRRLLKDSAIK